MNLLSGGFLNFINGIFSNWQMILFILLVVLLLLVIVFRKVRIIKFIGIIAVPIITIALVVSFIVLAVGWAMSGDYIRFVQFAVRWIPTILFAAIVVLSTWLGTWRGLRKSLILLSHRAAVGVVVIVLYALLVNLPSVDAFMLNTVEAFMGGVGSLRDRLGVYETCSGLKDVFVYWLPTVFTGDIGVLLGGSEAYIRTLADLIYHVSFAVFLGVLYEIVIFILYIIYHCCYSERKYKRKIEAAYVRNKVDRRYSRHPIGGGVYGLAHGCVSGILWLSALGSVLFMVAGRGEGKLPEADIADPSVSSYYSIYREVESYGNYGVYKVLNAIDSPDGDPYYFLVPDLIFSGKLKDEEFGVEERIIFREEIGAYTGFARDTVNLLLKYGAEDLLPVISQGVTTKDVFDRVVDVMSDDAFRTEFDDLINEFDSQIYIRNFALSFVNTAIANVDDLSELPFLSSISENNRELLKIMFTKGHLSDYIPDEKLIKDTLEEDSEFSMPYLNVSKFADKKDIQIIYNVALDVLTDKTSSANDTVALVEKFIPKLKELSFFSDERAEEFNPVLGRLYCYAANLYLTEEGAEPVSYDSVYSEKIDWVGEIRSLAEVAESGLKLYDKIYDSNKKPIDMVVSAFDKGNPDYEEISGYYDAVCDSVAKSRLLGQVLSTSKTYNLISNALGGVFEGIYVPEDVTYESIFDEHGNLVSAGEVYNVLNGVRLLGRNTDILPMFKNFNSETDVKKLIDSLAEAVKIEDDKGNTVTSYVLGSDLLRSVLSAAIINYGDEYIYVPASARESAADGSKLKFIKRDEMEVLFENIGELAEFVSPLFDGEDADLSQAIGDFVKKDVFDELLDNSAVFEGTVAKLLVKSLDGNDTVIIPKALVTDLEGWITVKGSGTRGELKNLLDALEIVGVEVSQAAEGSIDKDEVIDNVLALTEEELNGALRSSVLHYTLTNFLTRESIEFGSFKLIVPAAAQVTLTDDVIDALIKKNEFANLLQIVHDFNLDDESTDVSSVFVQVVNNKDALGGSYILTASMAYAIANATDVADMLKLPQKYTDSATEDILKVIDSRNPWKAELPALVDALDEILEVSNSEEFAFDEDKLKDNLSTLLNELNAPSVTGMSTTRLNVCYKSEIIRNNITERLDEILTDKVEESLLIQAKEKESGGAREDGYYTKTELSSLCNALNIFEIDLLNFESEALTEKVKGELLSLNEPDEEYGGMSRLEVIYPSVIFSGMFSKELDKALLENEDDSGNPAPMIDGNVLAVIKSGARYSREEFKNLINGVKELGVDKFDDIDSIDFNTVLNENYTEERIEKICLSEVLRGVLTHHITESESSGDDQHGIDADHPKAYESAEKKILKTQEIQSLVTLINELNEGAEGDKIENIENMYFDGIDLRKLRKNTFDESGEVKSYLLLKGISSCVKDSDNLYINDKLIDSYECLDGRETVILLDTIIMLSGDSEDSEVSIHSFNTLSYPKLSEEQRTYAFSGELVRAKLTAQIISANPANDDNPAHNNYVTAKNIVRFRDWHTGQMSYALTKSELNALFDVLDLLGGDTYEIPVSFNLAKINELYGGDENNLDKLFASDIIRYKVCATVLKKDPTLSESTEEAYNVANLVQDNIPVVAKAKVKEFLDGHAA